MRRVGAGARRAYRAETPLQPLEILISRRDRVRILKRAVVLVRVPRQEGARPVARVRHLVGMRRVGCERRPSDAARRELRPEVCHATLEARARNCVAESRVHPRAVDALTRVEGRHCLPVVCRVGGTATTLLLSVRRKRVGIEDASLEASPCVAAKRANLVGREEVPNLDRAARLELLYSTARQHAVEQHVVKRLES